MVGARAWMPLAAGYEVSKDGYLRTRKYLRMIVPHIRPDRAPAYVVTIDGKKVSRRIAEIVESVFGITIVVTNEMAEQMRLDAMRHNETRGKWIDQRKAAAARKAQEKKIVDSVTSITQEISMPPLKSDCPFPAMRTGVTGYATYDDPQIDPMSCGTWWVRVEMEENVETNEIAEVRAA